MCCLPVCSPSSLWSQQHLQAEIWFDFCCGNIWNLLINAGLMMPLGAWTGPAGQEHRKELNTSARGVVPAHLGLLGELIPEYNSGIQVTHSEPGFSST